MAVLRDARRVLVPGPFESDFTRDVLAAVEKRERMDGGAGICEAPK